MTHMVNADFDGDLHLASPKGSGGLNVLGKMHLLCFDQKQ